ncbi:cupredoxin domain-containing protein [Cohnella herbarum]|uniref:Cytochrome C oxidase subunit II n=1 Tax=Cohnella herbarum TaxID=2728023 RepID=A0A7Z2ZPM9_9BACL|nr:cupredoxin domain-containing protein [Cohnella herbarum]QJD87503.1 cytochrome C oxidase subunit II [Cohnella herbarum]
MKKPGRIFAIVALAAVFALSGCGNKNNNTASPSPSPSPTASTPAAGGGGMHDVTIDATNWKFEPAEIKAKVGDTLKLTLKNSQGAHGIASDDLGIKLKNGETQEIKLEKAGTFEYHCSIQCGQGHDNMVGNIIVE